MAIDTNDDGMISPDEAAAHAEVIFVLLDRNMDGVLSAEDWGKRAGTGDRDRRQVGEKPRGRDDDAQRAQATESQQSEAGAEAQARRDSPRRGQRHDGDARGSARWQEVFREMDQDDDGRVTMEEFMSYHEERYHELAGDEGGVSPWRYRASWHVSTSGSD